MTNRGSFLLLLFIFVVNCSLRGAIHKSERNYFHPSFQCLPIPGWENQAGFLRYKSDWFKIKELYNLDNQQRKKSEIVIAGDSLVHAMTPDILAEEFPGKDITNRGIGGDMTETLLERWEENVLSLTPKIIIIEIGGNDMIMGKCLSTIERNVIELVESTRRRLPNTKIIFMTVPPTLETRLNMIVPIHNSFLYSLPERYNKVVILEIWREMREADRPTVKMEYVRENGDPIHFNRRGYALWGKLIRPHLL